MCPYPHISIGVCDIRPAALPDEQQRQSQSGSGACLSQMFFNPSLFHRVAAFQAEHQRHKESMWPAHVVTLSPETDQPSTSQGLVQLILERARSAVRNKERCITIARCGTRHDSLLVQFKFKQSHAGWLHAQLGPAWSAVHCDVTAGHQPVRHAAAQSSAVASPSNWLMPSCVFSADSMLHAATACCSHAQQ